MSDPNRAPVRLLIVGLGNPMMADDGVGHAVVAALGCFDLPQHVRLLVIDDDLLALTRMWEGERTVWIVDAVSSNAPAGTRHVFGHHDLLQLPAGGRLSAHHLSLGESLRWILLARPEMSAVEFRLFGIEVGVVSPRCGLTDTVLESVTDLVKDIRIAIRKDAAWSSGGESLPGGRAREVISS